MERDPVCGMEVDDTSTALTSYFGGQTFYFCSEECRKQFEENPQRYAKQEAA